MNEVKKKEAISTELNYAKDKRAYLEANLKVKANNDYVNLI